MDISALFPENDRPLETLLSDGGFSGVFRTIACVGDSLSSGEFVLKSKGDGKYSYYDMFDYSWGQYMARINGQTVYNFSRGGMTAKEYMDSYAEKKCFFDREKRAQAYIIALGVNDVSQVLEGKLEFGDLSDIDLSDYHNNKQTFVGYYAAIIQKYKEISPLASFFLMTMPRTEANDEREKMNERHKEVLTALCERLDHTYLLDLRTYAPIYDEAFREKFYMYGHLTPAGYLLTGKMVVSYLDYIVRHNLHDFDKLGFVGNPGDTAEPFFENYQ